MLTIDRANFFTKCAALGQDPGELSPEEREAYERIKQQVAEMMAKGMMPDLPTEL